MNKEDFVPFSEIDLSIDPKVIERGEQLMGEKNISAEEARQWINSPVKKGWNSLFLD